MIAHDITTNMTDSVGKLIALGGGRDWITIDSEEAAASIVGMRVLVDAPAIDGRDAHALHGCVTCFEPAHMCAGYLRSQDSVTGLSWGHRGNVRVRVDWLRVAVRWGSGFTTQLSVYQWQTGGRLGHWRHVFVPQGYSSAPLKAVSDRSYGQLDRRSELEVYFRSRGPSIQALGTWLGREYVRLRAEHEAKTEASKAITRAPGRRSYTEEQQAQINALRFDRNLPMHISNLAGGGARLEVFGLFLRKLGHGGECLVQEHACEVGTYISTADADELCYIAVELGLAAPACYAGPSGAKIAQDGQLSGPAQLAWNKHGRGPWGKNEPVTGARFWCFGRGRRYAELPDYT